MPKGGGDLPKVTHWVGVKGVRGRAGFDQRNLSVASGASTC